MSTLKEFLPCSILLVLACRYVGKEEPSSGRGGKEERLWWNAPESEVFGGKTNVLHVTNVYEYQLPHPYHFR